MTSIEWQPYREPFRATLTRTIGIAVVVGGIVALSMGHLSRWPIVSLLILWPSFGGHWIDLLFLNWLRPRIPNARLVQIGARLAMWFAGGVAIAFGLRLTAAALPGVDIEWLTWARAGVAFVAIELVAHGALQARGRPSFYNGRG